MESVIQVQILDEADCISLHANALGNSINPFIPPTHLWVNSRAEWSIEYW